MDNQTSSPKLWQDAERPLDIVNITFLLTTPIIAVVGIALYTWRYGFHWGDFALWIVLHYLTSMCVTAGYHRYYSHRTFQCSKLVQLYFLVFGAAAVENSLLKWASDHRYHHRFVDTDEDPYNILKGGLYAHMGWIFYKDTRDQVRRWENATDLMKDPLVMWQHKYYLPLVVGVTFLLPTVIGMLYGRPLGGLLWGGFLRAVVVQHTTFFVNSWAHLWGTKPYSLTDTARDSTLLAPITLGEGYHNFHHKFQADYRNGLRWWQFDPTKWFILALEKAGLAWGLKRTPEPLILKAKLEVQKQLIAERVAAAQKAAQAHPRLWEKVSTRLEAGSQRVYDAHAAYVLAKAEYKHRAREWSADVRRQWKGKLALHRAEYEAAMIRWRGTLRAMHRLPQPSASGLLSLAAVIDVLKYRFF